VKYSILVVLLLLLLPPVACGLRPRPVLTCTPGSTVDIPAGWFLMGEDEGQPSHQPQRRVYLDAYAMDCTEVTNADFAAFVAETGYEAIGWERQPAEEASEEPVTGVLWRDADTHCRWMGKRLPTEAEWERAARGTEGHRYPWGSAWDSDLANTVESGPGHVLPVGSYPDGASPDGVLDMAGNAAEWVADTFDAAYYSYAPDRNPPGPDVETDHVLRGGSWASPREQAQTFFRDSSHSTRPNWRVGFRCARSMEGVD